MQILAKIKEVKAGYNKDTMELFLIDQLGYSYINIVPIKKVIIGEIVKCNLYINLYSAQVESITKL